LEVVGSEFGLRLGNRGIAAQWLESYAGALAPVLSNR